MVSVQQVLLQNLPFISVGTEGWDAHAHSPRPLNQQQQRVESWDAHAPAPLSRSDFHGCFALQLFSLLTHIGMSQYLQTFFSEEFTTTEF
jgi:hypothetical protein